MRRYRKSDVDFHGEYMRSAHPAVNVRCRNFPDADDIAKRFGCSQKVAEKAGQFAWDGACRTFWDYWSDVENIKEYFGSGVEAFSEGRSEGWLVVSGLPEWESWDAVMLSKWRRFELDVLADVKYRSSEEVVFDDIDANRWAEEGAEEFNFLDAHGKTVCMVDLNAHLRQATQEFIQSAV